MDFAHEGDKKLSIHNTAKERHQDFNRPRVNEAKATEMVSDAIENKVDYKKVFDGIKWISRTKEYAGSFDLREAAIRSLNQFAKALNRFDRSNPQNQEEKNKVLKSLERSQGDLARDARSNEAIRLVLIELAKPVPSWHQEGLAPTMTSTGMEFNEKLWKDNSKLPEQEVSLPRGDYLSQKLEPQVQSQLLKRFVKAFQSDAEESQELNMSPQQLSQVKEFFSRNAVRLDQEIEHLEQEMNTQKANNTQQREKLEELTLSCERNRDLVALITEVESTFSSPRDEERSNDFPHQRQHYYDQIKKILTPSEGLKGGGKRKRKENFKRVMVNPKPEVGSNEYVASVQDYYNNYGDKRKINQEAAIIFNPKEERYNIMIEINNLKTGIKKLDKGDPKRKQKEAQIGVLNEKASYLDTNFDTINFSNEVCKSRKTIREFQSAIDEMVSNSQEQYDWQIAQNKEIEERTSAEYQNIYQSNIRTLAEYYQQNQQEIESTGGARDAFRQLLEEQGIEMNDILKHQES